VMELGSRMLARQKMAFWLEREDGRGSRMRLERAEIGHWERGKVPGRQRGGRRWKTAEGSFLGQEKATSILSVSSADFHHQKTLPTLPKILLLA
jgi:hypothetical protein